MDFHKLFTISACQIYKKLLSVLEMFFMKRPYVKKKYETIKNCDIVKLKTDSPRMTIVDIKRIQSMQNREVIYYCRYSSKDLNVLGTLSDYSFFSI